MFERAPACGAYVCKLLSVSLGLSSPVVGCLRSAPAVAARPGFYYHVVYLVGDEQSKTEPILHGDALQSKNAQHF